MPYKINMQTLLRFANFFAIIESTQRIIVAPPERGWSLTIESDSMKRLHDWISMASAHAGQILPMMVAKSNLWNAAPDRESSPAASPNHSHISPAAIPAQTSVTDYLAGQVHRHLSAIEANSQQKQRVKQWWRSGCFAGIHCSNAEACTAGRCRHSPSHEGRNLKAVTEFLGFNRSE